MPSPELVYLAYRQALDSLDGVPMGAAYTTGAYIPVATDTTLDDITGEATAGDIERMPFTGSWDPATSTLSIDEADQWPSTDSTGNTITGAVTFKGSDLTLVSYIPLTEYEGVDGDQFQPLNGIGRATDGAALTARVEILAAELAALEGLTLSDDDPEPAGVADPGVSTEASRSDHVHPAPAPGEWVELLPQPDDPGLTYPAFVDPSSLLAGLGEQVTWAGLRCRLTSWGQIELEGAVGYVSDATTPTPMPTSADFATLPEGMRPITPPVTVAFEFDPGTYVSTFSAAGLTPSTGVLNTASDATQPVLRISQVFYDPA